MNFVISLLFWTALFVVASISKSFATSNDWHVFLLTCQVLVCVTFFIFLIAAVFFQMNKQLEASKLKNTIEKRKKLLDNYKEKYEELKTYYKLYLAEKYPELEKEIFNKISSDNSKKLLATLNAYPELKTSVVFKEMITNISENLQDIVDVKSNINEAEKELEDIKCNNWVLIKIK